MDSNDLRREHARVIQASIQPMCVYLNQLKQRMAERGFRLTIHSMSWSSRPSDPLARLDERMAKKQNDRR